MDSGRGRDGLEVAYKLGKGEVVVLELVVDHVRTAEAGNFGGVVPGA